MNIVGNVLNYLTRCKNVRRVASIFVWHVSKTTVTNKKNLMLTKQFIYAVDVDNDRNQMRFVKIVIYVFAVDYCTHANATVTRIGKSDG